MDIIQDIYGDDLSVLSFLQCYHTFYKISTSVPSLSWFRSLSNWILQKEENFYHERFLSVWKSRQYRWPEASWFLNIKDHLRFRRLMVLDVLLYPRNMGLWDPDTLPDLETCLERYEQNNRVMQTVFIEMILLFQHSHLPSEIGHCILDFWI